jgi:superfamily II DNA/RNA helicase
MMFVNKASEEVVEAYVPQHSFEDFNMAPQVYKNVISKGYVSPTPIQDQVIPVIQEGKDVVGIANTGTGKTAAFLIPLIGKLLRSHGEKALIITPTRELAVQVEQEFRELARGTSLHSVICIGGVGLGGQIQRLSRRPQVVVGTPGRLKDLEQQRKIHFDSFQNIVLDEVDRMLDMGFINDVSYIVNQLPADRLSLFFSATLPDSVQRVMKDFTQNPVVISVKTRPTSANVDQDIIRLNGRDKMDVLDELLDDREFEKVLVFGRTKHGIDKIQRSLEQRRVSVAVIHGNKSQGQRQKALEMFKGSRVQVLLATDIASRGLDISNVTHVINYDLPETYEDYIHRIGRTGRANKKGKALTFVD